MDGLIRASSLQGFDGLVGDLGGDPAPLHRRVGLRPGLVDEPQALLPYRALAELVEEAAAALGRPDFGLLLSQRQGIEILGTVALIARHSTTAREAMAGLRRYLHSYSTAFEVDVAPLTGDVARYTFTVVLPRVPRQVQILELSLGVSMDLFRILFGRDFRPRRALLPHSPAGPPEAYREIFGCPVEFEAPVCGLDVDAAGLDRRRAGEDRAVRDLAEQYLHDLVGPEDGDPTVRVRELLRRLLPTGQAGLVVTAGHLGMHPRTLQRRLREDGTSFERLLDELRRELAGQYLCHSDRPLPQVSSLLGYSEQSCLTRSCRRWFGMPPLRVRGGAARCGAGPPPGPATTGPPPLSPV
ncbi:AraC family transcriptional regulator [Pseudonocardia sp. TMWB2A]|uniref:AraC family transcriptional regulator n=1 Tax=Pseudonocardia sp. TMWB2A TaxID=687430 RepID=UPI00307E56B3